MTPFKFFQKDRKHHPQPFSVVRIFFLLALNSFFFCSFSLPGMMDLIHQFSELFCSSQIPLAIQA
jgi:hypothetical protein